MKDDECEGWWFLNIERARVMKDGCSPGSGPGTCGVEWGASRNCVIFVGVDFGARCRLFVGTGPIASSLALMDCGDGGVMTIGAAGGVGGYECMVVLSEVTLSVDDFALLASAIEGGKG